MKDISNKSNGIIVAILLYVFFGLYFVFQVQSSYDSDQLRLYFVLIGAYFWIAGLLVAAKIRHNLYIFEPIFFIAMLYLCIYVYKPLMDLRTDSFFEHGVYIRGGGIKATLIIILSFTIFYISYYSRHPRLVFGKHLNKQAESYARSYDSNISSQVKSDSKLTHAEAKSDVSQEELVENSSQLGTTLNPPLYIRNTVSSQTVVVLYFFWSVVFAFSIGAMLSQGLNLRYIFTLGISGLRESNSSTALLFLSNFGITSVSLWLLIMRYSKNIPGKFIITVLEIIYLLTRNGRWLILAIALAPVVYYFIKHKKSPRVGVVLAGSFVLLIIFAWMQANRYGIRTGIGYSVWGNQIFSLQVLTSPFESDFNTYRLFYSMVMRYPSVYSYMGGATFIYVFTLIIPRVIWPSKPNNPVLEIIEHSLNASARQSGTAISNIGELYANFGVVGCVIGMYLGGWIASKMKELLYSDDEFTLAMYSILYPLLFQWTARGMFSSNLFTTIFAILPFMFLRRKQNRSYLTN